jgi:hypothetical protein
VFICAIGLIVAEISHKYIINNLSTIGINSVKIGNVVTDESATSYKIILIFFTSIVEEFLYRYGLVFSKNKTSLLLLGWFYTLYIFIKPKEIDINNPKHLLLFIIFFVSLFFIFRFFVGKNSNFFSSLYQRKFNYIFALSVMLFAYSHLTLYSNYKDLTTILFSPIILLTYFIAGILYGLIRIRFGFVWCCIAHIIWNTISVLC